MKVVRYAIYEHNNLKDKYCLSGYGIYQLPAKSTKWFDTVKTVSEELADELESYIRRGILRKTNCRWLPDINFPEQVSNEDVSTFARQMKDKPLDLQPGPERVLGFFFDKSRTLIRYITLLNARF